MTPLPFTDWLLQKRHTALAELLYRAEDTHYKAVFKSPGDESPATEEEVLRHQTELVELEAKMKNKGVPPETPTLQP